MDSEISNEQLLQDANAVNPEEGDVFAIEISDAELVHECDKLEMDILWSDLSDSELLKQANMIEIGHDHEELWSDVSTSNLLNAVEIAELWLDMSSTDLVCVCDEVERAQNPSQLPLGHYHGLSAPMPSM